MKKLNLKTNFFKIFCIAFLVFLTFNGFSQLTVPNYTACPNQVVTVTAVWNQVSINSMTLTSPANTSPVSGPLGPGNIFTITCGPNIVAPYAFTLCASGTSLSGAVNACVVFVVNIIPPAPLNFSATPNYYCAGSCASIVTTPGYNQYNLSSTNGFNGVFSSNIMNICNLSSVHNGTYNVTGIGTCTATGVTTINVAPNTPLTVNGASNVCLGGTVNLVGNIPSGQNYQWLDVSGAPRGSGNTYLLSSAQATDNGVWTCTVTFPFGSGGSTTPNTGTTCPVTAVTSVSVVLTSPVSATASPAGIVCENDKINLNAGAGGAFGWSWSGPASFSSSIANPVINPAKPNNTGQYIVTALFTNNVITCTTSAVVNVSVIPVNQPAITMPNSVCQGVGTISIVNFSATANSASAWQWTGPNGFSSASQATNLINPQPNASGIYYVTARFGAAQYSCTATNSAQLNVVPVNTVSVIPPAPVCMPNNGILQANAIGASQYSWVGPNNFVSPSSNPIVYYPNTNATGVYTVTAFFQGSNIICSNSNTVFLQVNPILIFSLTPRQQACYSTPITINGPNGATSYTWTSSNGFTSNSKNVVFTSAQPPNSGTYTLNISLGPCITSASTSLEILTPITFTLEPLSRSVCSGDTTYATVGVTGGSQNYAYDWNPSIYFTDDQRGPKKTIIPISTINYNITVYDIACPNYTIPTSFSLTVKQPPKPNLEKIVTRGCVPFVQTYNPQTKAEAFVTTFDFGGFTKYQLDSTGNKMVIPLKEAGIYTLTVYSQGKNGCLGTYKYPYPITVDPKPGSDIIWSPEMPTTSDIITLTPLNLNGPIEKRFWMFSGGQPSEIDTSIKITAGTDTSNVFNPTRKYNLIGRYPIMLVSQTEVGCVDTIVRFITITDDFKVFVPNSFTPNSDGLNDVFLVKGSGIKAEGFSMELKDRWGNTIFSSTDINVGWDGRVNGINAELGTYVYRIRATGMNGEGRKEIVGYFSLIR
jgi:gliding motility-associated-like protein